MDANRKGTKIRFVGGAYIGKTGWIDQEGDETEKSYAVIVRNVWKKNGTTKADKATKVRKRNVATFETQQASCYVEAVMVQQPEVEQNMMKLCRLLAMCDVDPNDENILRVFKDKPAIAVKEQKEKGPDANWK